MFVTPGYAQESVPADAEAHTEVGVDGEGGVFPPFDSSTFPSQLLWLAITFGLLYLFLKKVLLPRIDNILEVRSKRIADDLAEAERLKEEADAAVAAYEQELAEAKANANAIGQKARDAAKAEAEADRKQVEAELGRKLSDAEAHIAGIKSRAMQEVGAIAQDTSAAIIEQLTGTKADQAALAAAIQSVRT